MEVPMGLLRTNEIPPNPHAHPDAFQEHVSGRRSIVTVLVTKGETPEERKLKLLKDSEGDLFLADGVLLHRLLGFTHLGIEAKILDTSEHKVYYLSNAAFLRLTAECDVLEKK